MNGYEMTRDEYEELLAEWGEKTTTVRDRLAKRLEQARSLGSLSMNFAYDVVRADIDKNEARIKELERLIRLADITDVPKIDPDGIYEIIPVSERPYYWAYREMKMYYPHPKKLKLIGLDEVSFSSILHTAIFHIDDESKPDILRIYWRDEKMIKFMVLTNYTELKEQYPEMLALLERNGKAVYGYYARKREDLVRQHKKVVDYEPFSPYRKRDDDDE